jgi:transitional endoplasmic reticulum ATPase
VAQLLTLLDGLDDRGAVVVIAATNLPEAIDPALRRPGRLEREIAIPPPGASSRRDILEVHFARTPLAADADLGAIAEAAQGYVGADLAALAREAALAALARATRAAGGEVHVDAAGLAVTRGDLEHALAVTAPSVLRGSGGAVRGAALSDVAGLDAVKARLLRAVGWTRGEAGTVARFRVVPPRGILLTGPPGCGKTLLARALAAHVGMNFVSVRATDLLTRHFGEAEQAVARLFATARHSAPTLLFFDEFDALAARRQAADGASGRIVAQLLVEIDGIAGRDGVVLLAATNRPDALDPAITRPGRFDEVIEIPMPDAAARHAILEVHLEGRPLAPGVDLAILAKATDGATGADVASIAAAAAREAAAREIARGHPDFISQADLEDAVETWKKGVTSRRADFIDTEGQAG